MRMFFGLLLLIFVAAPVPYRALAAPDKPCTAATAAEVSIEAIHADENAWLDRCVRVRGLYVGGAWNAPLLLADREALMEPHGLWDGDMRRSIILLPRSRRPLAIQPAQLEVVGVVGSCRAANDAVAAEQDAHPDQILMVGGYCHTSLATFIGVRSVHVLSRAPVMRLTEPEVPLDRRALIAATPDIGGYAEQLAAARAMIRALATGDARRFADLRVPEPAGPGDLWLLEQRRDARRLFDTLAPCRPVARLAYRAEDTRMRVFVGVLDLANWREEPRDFPQLITCWCKTPDCAGRWPVTGFDADNRPGRPYVCVSTRMWINEPEGPRVEAAFPAGRSGFAEPKWPRRSP